MKNIINQDSSSKSIDAKLYLRLDKLSLDKLIKWGQGNINVNGVNKYPPMLRLQRTLFISRDLSWISPTADEYQSSYY